MNDLRKFVRLIIEDYEEEPDAPEYKRITNKTTWGKLHLTAHRTPDEMDLILKRGGGGVTDEDLKRYRRLLDAHRIGGEGQHESDQEIVDHIDAKDGVGLAFRRRADRETGAYLRYKDMYNARREHFEDELQRFKAKWDSHPDKQWRKDEAFFEGVEADYGETWSDEQYWQAIVKAREERFKEENEPIYVYRKTAKNDDTRRLLAYTMDSRGAHMGNSGHLRPNKSILIDDLLAQGWKILGGIVGMMGSPGESEITFVKYDD